MVIDFWLKILTVSECLLQTQNSEQSKVHLKRKKSNTSTHNISHPNPIQPGHFSSIALKCDRYRPPLAYKCPPMYCTTSAICTPLTFPYMDISLQLHQFWDHVTLDLICLFLLSISSTSGPFEGET